MPKMTTLLSIYLSTIIFCFYLKQLVWADMIAVHGSNESSISQVHPDEPASSGPKSIFNILNHAASLPIHTFFLLPPPRHGGNNDPTLATPEIVRPNNLFHGTFSHSWSMGSNPLSSFLFGAGNLFGMGDDEDAPGSNEQLICLPLCSCKLDLVRKISETTCRSLTYHSLTESIENLTMRNKAVDGRKKRQVFPYSSIYTTNQIASTQSLGSLVEPANPELGHPFKKNSLGHEIPLGRAHRNVDSLWKRNRGRVNSNNPEKTLDRQNFSTNHSPTYDASTEPQGHHQTNILVKLMSNHLGSPFGGGHQFFHQQNTRSPNYYHSVAQLNVGPKNVETNSFSSSINSSGHYNISTLTLTFNDIPRLGRQLFKALSKLDEGHGLDEIEEIYFFFNKIRQIDVDTFEDFRRPANLENAVSANATTATKGVKILKIVEHHWHLQPKDYFDTFDVSIVEPLSPSLEELFVSSPNLKTFNLSSFGNFKRLKTIFVKSFILSDLGGNNLTGLISSSEVTLPPYLKDLRLTSDAIAEIPGLIQSSDVKATPNLTSTNAGESLLYLEKFTISSQALNRILKDDLSHTGYSGLRELHLINSNLSWIHGEAFTPLSESLVHLDLHNNKLGTFEARTFNNLKKLQYLDLSGNEIIIIPSGSFRNLPSLQFLSLKYNQIVRFGDEDPTATHSNKDIFTETSALRNLLLKSNSLRQFPTEVVSRLPKLEFLDVSRNYIERLDAHTFEQNKKLERIDLSSNLLKVIEAKAFDGLETTLYDLKLYHNNLNGSFESRTFSNLKNLTVLDVSYNNLTTIDPSSFVNCQDSLLYIDIAFNPWHCDCKMKNFRAWMEERISNLFFLHQFRARAILSRAKCASPPHMANVPLSFPHLSAFVCEEQTPWLFQNPNKHHDGESFEIQRNYSDDIFDEIHKAQEPKFIRDHFYSIGSLNKPNLIRHKGPEQQRYDLEMGEDSEDDEVPIIENDKAVRAFEPIGPDAPAILPEATYEDTNIHKSNNGELPFKESDYDDYKPNNEEGQDLRDGNDKKLVVSALKKQQKMDIYLLKEIRNLYTLLARVVKDKLNDNLTTNDDNSSSTLNGTVDKHVIGSEYLNNEQDDPITINSLAYKRINEKNYQSSRSGSGMSGFAINLTLTIFTMALVLYLLYTTFCRRSKDIEPTPFKNNISSTSSSTSRRKCLRSSPSTLSSLKYSVNSLSSSIMQNAPSRLLCNQLARSSQSSGNPNPIYNQNGEIHHSNNTLEAAQGMVRDGRVVRKDQLSPASDATDTPCLKSGYGSNESSPTKFGHASLGSDDFERYNDSLNYANTNSPLPASDMLGSHLSASTTSLTSHHLPGKPSNKRKPFQHTTLTNGAIISANTLNHLFHPKWPNHQKSTLKIGKILQFGSNKN